MIVMVFAFWAYSIAVSLARVRAIILERERHAAWAHDLREAPA
jgi:heme exporter protein C